MLINLYITIAGIWMPYFVIRTIASKDEPKENQCFALIALFVVMATILVNFASIRS